MGAGELGHDVMHVVVHAAQDGVLYRFGRVAADLDVAMQLLDPLQVDRRHHPDQQVDVARYVHAVSHHGAVQTLIEQAVTVFRAKLHQASQDEIDYILKNSDLSTEKPKH